MKVSSPLEIYKYLPKTNCGECGEKTCMAFAAQLIERTLKIEDCTPLLDEKFKSDYEELIQVMAPQVKLIEIGTGENIVKIGGEDVLHRHQLTFYDETALTYDVWDTMSDDELIERVNAIQGFKKFYVGEHLTLDMIAVRSISNDPSKFADCVEKVSKNTNFPLVLCSFDPKVLKAGLEVVSDKNPLIYAATEKNWSEVADLAIEYETPVTIFVPDDLDKLKSIASTFIEMGIDELVLDPGTFPTGEGLKKTLSNFVQLRRAGVTEDQKEVAFPLMSIPMTAWMVQEDPVSAAYWETVIASTFIVKYADIMILHSVEPYSTIPEVTLNNNIYTDPRRPVQVDPGIRTIGTPNESSPVFVTTNFALTYYTVESDLSSNGIDSYIVVTNTDGIGVEAAVAGGQLTPAKIKETLESDKDIKEKVNHGTIVIPGLAARLSGEAEEGTGWTVVVGPKDSGRIPGWMEENWPPK
ncbi:MAG: acetyl-CoA decarbonylase/synthase complex subunit gamma [Halobacteriota archaeon]|nr:acetyl-CoA decarbonylase/synthase complex subunit gamma [Halobacteriota archaeon]